MNIHGIRAKVLERQRKIFTQQGKYSDCDYRRLRYSRISMWQIEYSGAGYNCDGDHSGNSSIYF